MLRGMILKISQKDFFTRASLRMMCHYCGHVAHHENVECSAVIMNVHSICKCALICDNRSCHARHTCSNIYVCRHVSST